METLLQGMRGSVYVDDILIAGASIDENLQNIEAVLKKLKDAGLHLNHSKCFFCHSSLEYLGHIISEHGIQPTAEKVCAIKEAPSPKNLAELRAFLGLLNYYSKFLPNLSSQLIPLLNKNKKWHWGPEQSQAFQATQNALQANSLLVHYDPSKPIVLSCDASQYGIGAVLSHAMDNEQDRPIAYVSRTLSPAEKQLEKEALAIVFAVKKFHNFIYGRPFLIESDHRPLMFLFGDKSGIPPLASSRIQWWALTLSTYTDTIRYRAGKKIGHADALSRLPRPVSLSSETTPANLILLTEHLSSTCISAHHIKQWTSQDPVLSRVLRFILTGWPEHDLQPEFCPFLRGLS